MGTGSSPVTDMAMDLGGNQATLLSLLLISFTFYICLWPQAINCSVSLSPITHHTLVHHNSARLSSTARYLASPKFQQLALTIHVTFFIPLTLQYKFLMNLFHSKDIHFFSIFYYMILLLSS